MNSYFDRSLCYDGMVHYYKNGWLSNKWVVVYAKLWSDSTLEWFQAKGSDKPVGSINLKSLIPYICIGSHCRKIPTKKPKIEATWSRDYLMAVASDQKASTVHWFYFDSGDNLRRWFSEITQTLNGLPNYVMPRNDNFGRNYDAPITFETPRPNNTPQVHMISIGSKHGQHQKRSSFDRSFDDIMLKHGLGSFFFPMSINDSSSDSSDSDNDEDHGTHVTVMTDDGIHVTHHGDGIEHYPKSDVMGSGFAKVHHFEL